VGVAVGMGGYRPQMRPHRQRFKLLTKGSWMFASKCHHCLLSYGMDPILLDQIRLLGEVAQMARSVARTADMPRIVCINRSLTRLQLRSGQNVPYASLSSHDLVERMHYFVFLYFFPLFLIPCCPAFSGPLPLAFSAISFFAFAS
jgi:hypothetical protein